MQIRIPVTGNETDTLFGPEAPAPEISGGTPIGSAAFASWVEHQFKRVVVRQVYGRWESECPVCGDILYRIGSRSALLNGMRRHLDAYPPFGLEFLTYTIGDKFVHNGEDYEVYSGPHRPTAAPYRRQHSHVFFLILRKLSTGSLWQTSHKQAGELCRWRGRK